jgi:hypothetical protein
MGRRDLKKYLNEDGVPWLTIAEAKGISEYRFRKRLEEGYSPEEAADLANLTLSQRKANMLKTAIEENENND